MCPSYINFNNPKYLEIENYYISSLLIVEYYREQTDLIFKNLIDTNININFSIFYEKQDMYKVLKELTYNLGNVSVDIKESNSNRQDIEIAKYTYDDAKYIRKQLQINNDEIYYIYTYVTVYSKNLNELYQDLEKIENILQSKGLKNKKAYFRQEQTFLATLPFMLNSNDIKNATKQNILTSSLVSTYPFISSSIFDKEGIYIGKNMYNNS